MQPLTIVRHGVGRLQRGCADEHVNRRQSCRDRMPPHCALQRRQAHRCELFDQRLHADLGVNQHVRRIGGNGASDGQQGSIVIGEVPQGGTTRDFIGEGITITTGVDKHLDAFVGKIGEEALEVVAYGAVTHMLRGEGHAQLVTRDRWRQGRRRQRLHQHCQQIAT